MTADPVLAADAARLGVAAVVALAIFVASGCIAWRLEAKENDAAIRARREDSAILEAAADHYARAANHWWATAGYALVSCIVFAIAGASFGVASVLS